MRGKYLMIVVLMQTIYIEFTTIMFLGIMLIV